MELEKKLFDKYYWIPVVLTAVLCFGFTLTNHAVGVDDPTPQFVWYLDSKFLLCQGRWGYELISPFVNVSAFLPCWMDFISVCIYLLTGTLWVNVFAEASGGKYSKVSGVFFSCLFISFPYLARIFIYMSADLSSAFNMLFSSLGVWSTWKIFERQERKKENFIIAAACITVGFAFYESTIIYFVCGIMILFFLRSVCVSIDKLKTIICRMAAALVIVCCGVFLNRLILKIFLKYYHLQSNQYVSRYFSYDFEKNIFFQIWHTIQELAGAVFFEKDLVYVILRLSVVFILLISLCASVKKKNILPIVMAAGVIVSNFALILGTGNMDIMYDVEQNKQRTLVTYGLFTSFCISYFYSAVLETHIEKNAWDEKIKPILKYTIIAGMSVLVLKQSRETAGIFLADYQRADLDRQKAGYINYEVEKYDWKNKPVIFIGYTEDYLVTRDQDPLSSYFHFFGQWTELENHNYISFYMGGLGYVYPAGLEEWMMEDALQKSIQQPGYPVDGYVAEYEDYIVVKLGNG